MLKDMADSKRINTYIRGEAVRYSFESAEFESTNGQSLLGWTATNPRTGSAEARLPLFSNIGILLILAKSVQT